MNNRKTAKQSIGVKLVTNSKMEFRTECLFRKVQISRKLNLRLSN